MSQPVLPSLLLSAMVLGVLLALAGLVWWLRRRGSSHGLTVEEALELDHEQWMERILASFPEERFEGPELLGTGGMARVFRVRDTKLGRQVAFKMMDHASFRDPDQRRRFLREARAMAAMDAPGLPSIYDVSEEPVPYFVMQYIQGRSLNDLFEEEGNLPSEDVRRWLAEAARSLENVHESGIVHRDLKPENLMLDPRGRVWIIDFGIARDTSQAPITKVGTVMGTPSFVSPEQIAGAEPDPRMDVYSLAATGYFLLCGTYPYKLEQLVHPGPYEPRPFDQWVDAGLAECLRAALVLDSEGRTSTAAELATGLEELRPNVS